MSDWTFSIDDSSSIISYQPHGDGGVGDWTSTGWQPWYSQSGLNGFNNGGGADAVGNSRHITAFPDANLTFQFYGKGVSLFGTANCSYTVSVDGNTTTSGAKDGQLFQVDSLSESHSHEVVLIPQASSDGQFSFDRADITRSHLLQDMADGPSMTVYAATEHPEFFDYSGNWTIANDPDVPSKDQPAPYENVQAGTPSVSFSFRGTGVLVNGSRNWGSWEYAVNLDSNTSTYNASTMWKVPDALLFYQDGLDPQENHTLAITPKVGGGLFFRLSTITILNENNSTSPASTTSSTSSAAPTNSSTGDNGNNGNASPSSKSSKSSTGSIVGGVVGGIAGFAIISALLFWYLRSRRARLERAKRDRATPFLDPSPSPPPMTQADNADPAVLVSGALAEPPRSVGPPPRPSKLAAEQARAAQRAPVTPGAAASGPPASQAHSRGESATSPGGAPSRSDVTQGLTTPSAYSTRSTPAENSATGSVNAESNAAAVDRLIQLIVNRIDRTAPQGGGNSNSGRSDFGGSDIQPDHPPPSYSA